MRIVVFFIQKMHIVCRHQPDAQLLCQTRQLRIHHLLLFDSLFLHLNEKPLGAKNLQISLGDFFGRLVIAFQKRRRNLPTQTSRCADQPL